MPAKNTKSPDKAKSARKTRKATKTKESIVPLVAELSKLTGKIDMFQNRLELLHGKVELTNEKVDLINDRVEDSSDEVKELNAKVKKDASPQRGKLQWWKVVTGILGVPALLIYMYLQLNQAAESNSQTQLNLAEEQKARVELQQIINNLETTKSENPDAYLQQITEVLPRLQTALDKLNELDSNVEGSKAVENLYKSLLIVIFAEAVGYFLRVFEVVWAWLIATFAPPIYMFFYNRSRKSRMIERHRNKAARDRPQYRERLTNIYAIALSMLGAIPNFVSVITTIFIFATLTIPLFNLISLSLGIGIDFSSILDKLWRLDLPGAVNILRSVLFNN